MNFPDLSLDVALADENAVANGLLTPAPDRAKHNALWNSWRGSRPMEWSFALASHTRDDCSLLMRWYKEIIDWINGTSACNF
jgi:hypothetical protein